MRTSSLLFISILFSAIHMKTVLGFAVLPSSSPSVIPLTVLFDTKKESQTLGLLTFDLDDTLYPIAKVEEEANEAFVKAMERYGFGDQQLKAGDIVETAQHIRDELSEENPNEAAALTHNDLRLKAIRREMEKVTVARKLQACADDWATTVDALSPLVVANSKKWAKAAVNENMVRAVSTAWEMARHHAAEKYLYPGVLDVLQEIKEKHPGAIIGAVTDGRSNPLFMTFTLAPYFDFRCSWEDDQGTARRQEFFQQLEETGGDTKELSWIYDDARYKYAELKQAADGMKFDTFKEDKPLVFPATYDDRCWIHVGDDLAFDVGGSAACGARTIYAELDDKKYHQSARHRYDNNSDQQPSWSTTPQKELEMRNKMAKEAEKHHIDVRLKFLTRLPEAIDEILAAS